MGKNEFLTPKAIANRIKAKGLQKLRWYCQMCQKQCRDENGFKCHCMSESHQRQMQVFGQNPNRVIDGYSEEFESSFLEHMKRSHRFSRIAATVVYNEYIADRHHVHMNSTEWTTLTEFVKYLGRTGKCKVDETPKGWFITYIDRESETILKEKMKNKRLKSEKTEEERHEKAIAQQIERAEKFISNLPDDDMVLTNTTNNHQLQSESSASEQPAKVVFALGSAKSSINELEATKGTAPMVLSSVFEDNDNSKKSVRLKSGGQSVLEELMKEQEIVKEKKNRKDYWLFEGIIVKVMSKALIEKGYYKQKGIVLRVIDKYVAEIKMLEGGDMLRVDQQELETVIPSIGGIVKIVNGAYRGSNARLIAVDTENFCVKVQIEKGIYDGRVIQAIEYEDICKFEQI